MRRGATKSLRAVALSCCLWAAACAAAAGSWHDIPWYEDAAGYALAIEDAERTGRSVFVYFYADWCPYCRQFNEQLLADARVQGQLGSMLAVRVDAEAGPDERSLASHYRVRGYPALYVYKPQGRGEFQAIRRTVPGADGAPRLKTPEEFAATLRGAAR